jgi:parallel beta-helix repeat protein
MRGIRKISLFVLLFLILDIIFIPKILADSQPTNSLDNIIIVGKNDGDFLYIQEAINNAPIGSIIFIREGIYNETLNLNKKLTIIGENRFNTIINPTSEENKYAIKLGVSDIIIKNLSISNSAAGIYTTGLRINADKTKILNCNIYENPIGLAIFSNENRIDNCMFWNCRDEGIALIGTKISKCDYNVISNCTFFNNCDGLELQFSSNNLIENCSIYNNSHTGIDAIISSNNRNLIKKCKIYNNKVNGIYITSSFNNEIIKCIFWNNSDGNIIMSNDSNNINIDNEEIEFLNQNDKLINLNIENNKDFENYNITNNNILNSIIEIILNIMPFLKTLLRG